VHCDSKIAGETADTFVHANNDPREGGFGIFTFTGPTSNGHISFFRPYGPKGKENRGINADIEGAFVSFRFAWQGQNAIRPWPATEAPHVRSSLEIRTKQSVASALVQSTGVPEENQSAQAKQQVIIALINRGCARHDGPTIGQCQVQYLFNVAVFRQGVKNWEEAEWFKTGDILLDPGQNGIAVVHGPIPKFGESVIESGSGLSLYESRGEQSQHAPFKDREFSIRLTFPQLENSLRLISARRLHKSIAKVTDEEIENGFGASWNDPSDWALLSIAVAQEVHNPHENTKVFIGGSFTELSVKASSE